MSLMSNQSSTMIKLLSDDYMNNHYDGCDEFLYMKYMYSI